MNNAKQIEAAKEIKKIVYRLYKNQTILGLYDSSIAIYLIKNNTDLTYEDMETIFDIGNEAMWRRHDNVEYKIKHNAGARAAIEYLQDKIQIFLK